MRSYWNKIGALVEFVIRVFEGTWAEKLAANVNHISEKKGLNMRIKYETGQHEFQQTTQICDQYATNNTILLQKRPKIEFSWF